MTSRHIFSRAYFCIFFGVLLASHVAGTVRSKGWALPLPRVFHEGIGIISMAEKRDVPLQVQSLGRAGGTRFRQQNGSHESLTVTAHPLLSSSPSLATTSEAKNTSSEAVVPRYVPYTPRQRPATTAQPTTGTSSQSPTSIFGVQPGATPQLQLQNLKAAAQAISLPSASVGWAICEKLCTEGDKQEWDDIWKALIQQKVCVRSYIRYQVHSSVLLQATLFLPTDVFANADAVTPDFVRDHVVYCTAPSNRVIPVVTLSGLRGTISKFVHKLVPFDVLPLTRLIVINSYSGHRCLQARVLFRVWLSAPHVPLRSPHSHHYLPRLWRH